VASAGGGKAGRRNAGVPPAERRQARDAEAAAGCASVKRKTAPEGDGAVVRPETVIHSGRAWRDEKAAASNQNQKQWCSVAGMDSAIQEDPETTQGSKGAHRRRAVSAPAVLVEGESEACYS